MSVCKGVCISRQTFSACSMKWVCTESRNVHAQIYVSECVCTSVHMTYYGRSVKECVITCVSVHCVGVDYLYART